MFIRNILENSPFLSIQIFLNAYYYHPVLIYLVETKPNNVISLFPCLVNVLEWRKSSFQKAV